MKKILNGEEVEDYVAPEVPVETKDWMTTFLLCLFCGGLGVHRYYVGKIGTGILYTLTAGLFGIGYLVDFIKILCGKFRVGVRTVVRGAVSADTAGRRSAVLAIRIITP